MAATTAPSIPKLSFVDIFRSTKQLQRQYAKEKESKNVNAHQGDSKTKGSEKTKACDAGAAAKNPGANKASCSSHNESKRELQVTKSPDSSAPSSPSSKPAKKKMTPQSQWYQKPVFLDPFLAAQHHLHSRATKEPVSTALARHDVDTGRTMPLAACQHHHHSPPPPQPQPQYPYQIQQLDGAQAYVPGAFPHCQMHESGMTTPAITPQSLPAPIGMTQEEALRASQVPENGIGFAMAKAKSATSPPVSSATPFHAWTVEQDTCLEQLKLKGSSWRAIEQTLNIARNECRMRYAELKRIKKEMEEKEEKEDHKEGKGKDDEENGKKQVSFPNALTPSLTYLVLPLLIYQHRRIGGR